MVEYIERETAIMTAMNHTGDGNAQDASQDIAGALGCIPVADVRPVVRGEWIKKNDNPLDGEFYCSACREDIDIADGEETPLDRGFNFCPNCGADMREVNND